MAVTKKTYYGSGRFYTDVYDEKTFPAPKDPKNITAAEKDALVKFIAERLNEDYQIGYLKNGYQFSVKTEKLSDKSDLGEMKIDVITDETATVAISLFNANGKTISEQYPTAKFSEVDGYEITTIGGVGDIDETEKVLIFKHDDSAHGDTVVLSIGKNTSGFDAVWKQDSVTPFTVNYDIEPYNDGGNFAMLIDCPVGVKWEELADSKASSGALKTE
ncbi:MAG: hypothetical protein NC078_12685 [Ruminococcus sp.]|nr:hypothetical protein [Ruminococcus sp.]